MKRPSKAASQETKTGTINDLIKNDTTMTERQAQIKKAQKEDAASGSSAPAERGELPPFAVTAGGEFFRVPNAILDDSALSSIGKIVMIALYRFADDKGVSSPPSKGLLSSLCGITDRWLYLTLKDLETRRYISGIKGDGKRIKQYQLKFSFSDKG